MSESDDETEGDNGFDREALHLAAGRGDLRRVEELPAAGYPIGAFDDLSWTPLHHAALENHLEVARYLISAGADVNAREAERRGYTALEKVAQTCSLDMANMLVDAGADPTPPGSMGLTALHGSAQRKRGEGPDAHRLLIAAAQPRNPLWPRLVESMG